MPPPRNNQRDIIRMRHERAMVLDGIARTFEERWEAPGRFPSLWGGVSRHGSRDAVNRAVVGRDGLRKLVPLGSGDS
jgi:hypothetical protein